MPYDFIEEKGPLPPEIIKAGNVYFFWANLIQILLIVLGIIACVASLAIATFTEYLDQGQQSKLKVVAFVAALASGLLTTFSISKKNQDSWAAWRMMNAAILRYQYDPAFTRLQLVDVWEQAEKILGNASLNEKL